MKIKLEGKTERGRAQVKNYGAWWSVISAAKYGIKEWNVRQVMQYVRPVRILSGQNGVGSHWMLASNDPDYNVVEVKQKRRSK